jgi:hypothetical protein
MSGGHINPLASFRPYEPFGKGFRLFWSKVIYNQDPKQLGRIKVQIPELLPWSSETQLPWIYPLFPAGLGQGPDTSQLVVPIIDSHVMVIFPLGNIYTGFYVWQAMGETSQVPDFLPNYPETYGFQDEQGNIIIINKDSSVNTIEITLSDGTHLKHSSVNKKTEITFVDQKKIVHDAVAEETTVTDNYGSSIVRDHKNKDLEVTIPELDLDVLITTLDVNVAVTTFVMTGSAGNLSFSFDGTTLSVTAPKVSLTGTNELLLKSNTKISME